VHIIYGSSDGLSSDGNQQWEQYDWGGSSQSESDDHFGMSLVAGRLDNNLYWDLAIGVPDEDIVNSFGTNILDAGAINILYGSAGGLSDSSVQFYYQGDGYIVETAEAYDQFGYTLASYKHFDYPSQEYLVVGVPYENLEAPVVADAGAVHILRYDMGRFRSEAGLFLHQRRENIPDEAEADDHFGMALASGDFNGDGEEEVAIGVPDEDCNATDDGAVVVMYGDSAFGDFQFWCQGSDGLSGTGELNDRFGLSLAAIPNTGTFPFRVYLPLCLK
jgi:hypothetical protein